MDLFMTVKAYANTTTMQKHFPLHSCGFMLIFSTSRVWSPPCIESCTFLCLGTIPPNSTHARKRGKGMMEKLWCWGKSSSTKCRGTALKALHGSKSWASLKPGATRSDSLAEAETKKQDKTKLLRVFRLNSGACNFYRAYWFILMNWLTWTQQVSRDARLGSCG